MTIFNPVWRVKIGGIQYTNYVLANLSITTGRTNIYEQANAGYASLELINLDQSNIDIESFSNELFNLKAYANQELSIIHNEFHSSTLQRVFFSAQSKHFRLIH